MDRDLCKDGYDLEELTDRCIGKSTASIVIGHSTEPEACKSWEDFILTGPDNRILVI